MWKKAIKAQLVLIAFIVIFGKVNASVVGDALENIIDEEQASEKTKIDFQNIGLSNSTDVTADELKSQGDEMINEVKKTIDEAEGTPTEVKEENKKKRNKHSSRRTERRQKPKERRSHKKRTRSHRKDKTNASVENISPVFEELHAEKENQIEALGHAGAQTEVEGMRHAGTQTEEQVHEEKPEENQVDADNMHIGGEDKFNKTMDTIGGEEFNETVNTVGDDLKETMNTGEENMQAAGDKFNETMNTGEETMNTGEETMNTAGDDLKGQVEAMHILGEEMNQDMHTAGDDLKETVDTGEAEMKEDMKKEDEKYAETLKDLTKTVEGPLHTEEDVFHTPKEFAIGDSGVDADKEIEQMV